MKKKAANIKYPVTREVHDLRIEVQETEDSDPWTIRHTTQKDDVPSDCPVVVMAPCGQEVPLSEPEWNAIRAAVDLAFSKVNKN